MSERHSLELAPNNGTYYGNENCEKYVIEENREFQKEHFQESLKMDGWKMGRCKATLTPILLQVLTDDDDCFTSGSQQAHIPPLVM